MKNKNRKKQNYILLTVIYIGVVVLVLYLASWYNTYRNYQNKIPVLKNIVFEINPTELDHYLTENPFSTLYLCAASDSDCREFEESIKSSIKENGYQDLVYVNLEDVEDRVTYVKEILKKYQGNDFNVDRVPCLIKFTDLKITAVEDGLNGALLTKDETLNFMDVNSKAGQ